MPRRGGSQHYLKLSRKRRKAIGRALQSDIDRGVERKRRHARAERPKLHERLKEASGA